MKSAHDLFSSLSYHIRLNNSILTEASDNSHLKRNFSIAFALKGTEMTQRPRFQYQRVVLIFLS